MAQLGTGTFSTAKRSSATKPRHRLIPIFCNACTKNQEATRMTTDRTDTTSTAGRIRALIAKDFAIAPERLTDDARLDELGVDSIGMAEVIFNLEDAFDLKLVEPPAQMETFGDVVRYVEAVIAEQRPSTPAAVVGAIATAHEAGRRHRHGRGVAARLDGRAGVRCGARGALGHRPARLRRGRAAGRAAGRGRARFRWHRAFRPTAISPARPRRTVRRGGSAAGGRRSGWGGLVAGRARAHRRVCWHRHGRLAQHGRQLPDAVRRAIRPHPSDPRAARHAQRAGRLDRHRIRPGWAESDVLDCVLVVGGRDR